MGVFTFITRGFIDFFGITQPTPGEQNRAVWFICALLALIVLGAGAIFFLVASTFGH
jgi:hypothetical protein